MFSEAENILRLMADMDRFVQNSGEMILSDGIDDELFEEDLDLCSAAAADSRYFDFILKYSI